MEVVPDNEVEDPLHYRILDYALGDLNLLVRVPVVCTMPTVDDGAMPNPGMAVACSTANEPRLETSRRLKPRNATLATSGTRIWHPSSQR